MIQKFIILFFMFFTFNYGCAQITEGKVVYHVTLNKKQSIKKLKKDTLMSENLKAARMEKINSSWPLKFFLLFNENEAIYKPEYDLNRVRDFQKGPNETGIVSGNDFVYYTNLKMNEEFKQYFFDAPYMVIRTDSINWRMENESKLIGPYLCHKATATLLEELPNHDIYSNKIVAWFTDQIPVTYGIRNLNGLPGLMIELDIEVPDGNLSYVVFDMDLNPKEKVIIKKPKGKSFSHHEWMDFIRNTGR